MTSHDAAFEPQFGHLVGSVTRLSGITAAGAQPEQHIIDLPQFDIAAPQFWTCSCFPKYQVCPHAAHEHLVS